MELIKKENEFLVSAKELYKELGIKRKYSTWIKESISRAGIEENEFVTIMLQIHNSGAGRPGTNHLLKKDAAVAIIMMSGGQFAKDLRKTLINLYSKHDTGLAFTAEQVAVLIDLSKAMTLVSNMKEAKNRHFVYFNDKYNWCAYHASVLGYSKESLMEKMREVNKKHTSNMKSLMHLDADELVRSGIIDLFIALGKPVEYAKNVGDMCKQISQKSEFKNMIWDDTQKDPLGLNTDSVQERKLLFINTKIN